ncbi:MAG: NAD(P)H-binding protein [Aeromicrobium sp.]
MKILVIGATGGSGRAVTTELLARGHSVTAFSRHASDLRLDGDLRTVDGDATRPEQVAAAMAGQDAVVVTLGISESAIRVRLRGAGSTADDVRSRGTRVAVDAMRDAGARRLVVQSSYGVGPTRPLLASPTGRSSPWCSSRRSPTPSGRSRSSVAATLSGPSCSRCT